MPRIALDLNNEEDRRKVKGVLRRALGFVPGQPNQGLVAEVEGSPARLADYDDSGWEACDNVRQFVSRGFTFGWWRFTLEVPTEINGMPVAGAMLVFEANIDDYGEIWVDGEIDLAKGTVAGWNIPQRVTVSPSAVPGARHVIACLAANGPLARPGGGIFMRYATLAFETREKRRSQADVVARAQPVATFDAPFLIYETSKTLLRRCAPRSDRTFREDAFREGAY